MEYIIQNDNKHLIILVHGLNGGDNSWRGSDERFVEVLSKNALIMENYDLAFFTYITSIFQINTLKKLINTIKGFLSNRPKEDIKGFNVGIETVSRPLEAEIRGVHEKYDTITIIAHSMGGLVTKSALTWLNEEARKKIKLFVSLSVPHIGAYLANLGSDLLGNNPQIIDLQAMGAFTTQLNERFASLKCLPKIVYQSGHQDTIVPRQSAIPPGVSVEFVESTADDHFSILLIKNSKNHSVFNRIIKELNIVLQPFLSIEIDIPENTQFGFLIETIASKNRIKVDLSCFDDKELISKLRAEKINSRTLEDLFLQVGDLTVDVFPKYIVKKEKGTLNYRFYKN